MPGADNHAVSIDAAADLDPLPSSVRVVCRRGFFLDNLPEWTGAGFPAGAFLLRSAGVLLRRSVSDSYPRNQATWHAGPWSVFHYFVPGTGQGQSRSRLLDLDYKLASPTPVAIDQVTAGPCPGMPEGATVHAEIKASARGEVQR